MLTRVAVARVGGDGGRGWCTWSPTIRRGVPAGPFDGCGVGQGAGSDPPRPKGLRYAPVLDSVEFVLAQAPAQPPPGPLAAVHRRPPVPARDDLPTQERDLHGPSLWVHDRHVHHVALRARSGGVARSGRPGPDTGIPFARGQNASFSTALCSASTGLAWPAGTTSRTRPFRGDVLELGMSGWLRVAVLPRKPT